MSKSYKLLPDIAIADVAFEAKASTLNELFDVAAKATFDVMADTSTNKPTITKEISLSSSTLENLLYDFLSEIIFIKDTDSMVFSDVKTTITEQVKKFHLKATLKGAPINPQKQKLGNDVKAVTMHMFEIKKVKEGYTARVVLDI
jgi:SHS2 domain-containing protein